MAVTGWKSSTDAFNEDRAGQTAWVATTNVYASDDSKAVCSIAKNTYGDWLRCQGFGFAVGDIPAGATIDGIEVQIEHFGDPVGLYSDSALYLRKASGQVGSNYASGTGWPSSDAYATYGGATNKWGTTWVDTDIKSIYFGVDLSIACGDDIPNTNGVDHIQIRVYYSLGGWAHIAEVTGVASANISERTGIAAASISEISGVAV